VRRCRFRVQGSGCSDLLSIFHVWHALLDFHVILLEDPDEVPPRFRV
jgi:hypothetical protein